MRAAIAVILLTAGLVASLIRAWRKVDNIIDLR